MGKSDTCVMQKERHQEKWRTVGGGGWESEAHEVGTGAEHRQGIQGTHLGKEKAFPTLVVGRQTQLWVGFRAGEVKEVVLIASGLCSHD